MNKINVPVGKRSGQGKKTDFSDSNNAEFISLLCEHDLSEMQIRTLACLDSKGGFDTEKFERAVKGQVGLHIDDDTVAWLEIRSRDRTRSQIIEILAGLVQTDQEKQFDPVSDERFARLFKTSGLTGKIVNNWLELGREPGPFDGAIRALNDAICQRDEQGGREVIEGSIVVPPLELFDNPRYIPPGSPIDLLLKLGKRMEVNDQPVARMVFAIGVMSHWTGRQVKTKTGSYSNIYIALVGPTASGKDVATKTAEDPILKNQWGVFPYSEAGLDNALAISPKRLLLEEELGMAFKEVTDGQASGNNSRSEGFYKTLVKLATSDGGIRKRKEYADTKRNGPDIIAPTLTVIGTSTPVKMRCILNAVCMDDGLLPRLLTFEMPKADREPGILEIQSRKSGEDNEGRKDEEWKENEALLAKFADKWMHLHGENESKFEWDDAPILKTFAFTSESGSALDSFYFANWKPKADKGDRYSNAYTRARVLASRIALILAANRLSLEDLNDFKNLPKGLTISTDDVTLACKLVDASARTMIRLIGQAEDSNEYSARLDRMEGVVKKLNEESENLRGALPGTISDRARSLSDCDKLLAKLVEAGRIIRIPPPPKGARGASCKPTYVHIDYAKKLRDRIVRGIAQAG